MNIAVWNLLAVVLFCCLMLPSSDSFIARCYLISSWQQCYQSVSPVFKPPPPVGAGGGYMCSGRPSVPPCVRLRRRDSRGGFMFPRYLQYLLIDFRQTFVTGCILGHRWPDYVFGLKGQRSRSHRRGGGAQHSMLPSSATFSSLFPVGFPLSACSRTTYTVKKCCYRYAIDFI